MDIDMAHFRRRAGLFWERVERAEECWPWTMARQDSGYGRARLPGYPTMPAHRVAYMLANGPIPDGYHIDHLCRNPPCCNPAHLEAVTPAENHRRTRRDFAASIHERVRKTGGSSWQVKWREHSPGSWRWRTRTFRTHEAAAEWIEAERARRATPTGMAVAS